MRVAVPDRHHTLDHLWRSVSGLLLCLGALPALAADVSEALCEYRSLEVDAQTGDIRFTAPVRSGSEDCSETGAAQGELDPGWRQKLPPRVRWVQRADALGLCESRQTALGQRTLELPDQGCVALQDRVACTIVTVQAISHAQLANAVRSCVP